MKTVKYTSEMLTSKGTKELRTIASEMKIANYSRLSKNLLVDSILKQSGVKAPKSGTKAEKIFADLKAGEKTMYRIAKDHKTYVSVVISVKKRYLA